MTKNRGKNKEVNWDSLFSISLVSLLLHSPYSFFFLFFFQMNFMIFSSYPSLPPHSIVLPLSRSLTSRQFSPDRFHSVLEGMDLIALWGLVGCAGLGCLISVPCRNWFNASWSWNCLIVQPSGDSHCLRRPAGLAKHCSRLLLYAAGGTVCLRNWNVAKVVVEEGQIRGHACEVDSLLILLHCRRSAQTSQEFISLHYFHLRLTLYGNHPIDY